MSRQNEGLLVTDTRVLTPGGPLDGWLSVSGTRIAALGSGDPPAAGGAEVVDGSGCTLAPGFVDVHVHGAVGHETMDADGEGLRAMARFFAGHGVTSFLPTTWTATREETTAALEAVAGAAGRVAGGARILGAHMEGPYLNAEKCGAQDTAVIRPANRAEARAFLDSGVVRLVALAPEIAENGWLIDECVTRGITVSAGHTAASYDEMTAAVRRGVRQATHLFNAMTGLHHREPGVVGAALTLPEVTCEVIADTVHVHPAALRVAYAAKGPGGLCLITDALRPTGLPPGDYRLGDRTVRHGGGAVRLPDQTLAGSVLTLDTALRNYAAATGSGIAELWPALSANPARAAGVGDRTGTLEAGKDADLVLLDDDLQVTLTVAQGEVVHRREDTAISGTSAGAPG